MKFSEEWTQKQDQELKDSQECDWDESCIMCKNYDDCIKNDAEN